MTTTISPSLGSGVPFVQTGPGASPGYSAIDLRRADTVGLKEGPTSLSSYTVAQRGAGANMSVDIAASTGPGAIIQGDSVTQQGRYVIPPHSAVINEAIATADGSNPRIDTVILEVKDDTSDASGANLTQTRVLTGTPTAGATLANRNGAAALPNTALALADVLVGTGVGSITTANCQDTRPKQRGFTNISTTETRTNTAYGTLTTPDQVSNVVLPSTGVLVIALQATWQESVDGAARAAVFIGANQLQAAFGGGPAVQEASNGGAVAIDRALATHSLGLGSSAGGSSASAHTGDVTTGQVLGTVSTLDGGAGGPCYVFAAAGTYTVSVQFKSSSGSVTAKNRKLWVEARDYDNAILS